MSEQALGSAYDALVPDLQQLVFETYLDLPSALLFASTAKRFRSLWKKPFGDARDTWELLSDLSVALGQHGYFSLVGYFLTMGWSIQLEKVLCAALSHARLDFVRLCSLSLTGSDASFTLHGRTEVLSLQALAYFLGESGDLTYLFDLRSHLAQGGFRCFDQSQVLPFSEPSLAHFIRGAAVQGRLPLLRQLVALGAITFNAQSPNSNSFQLCPYWLIKNYKIDFELGDKELCELLKFLHDNNADLGSTKFALHLLKRGLLESLSFLEKHHYRSSPFSELSTCDWLQLLHSVSRCGATSSLLYIVDHHFEVFHDPEVHVALTELVGVTLISLSNSRNERILSEFASLVHILDQKHFQFNPQTLEFFLSSGLGRSQFTPPTRSIMQSTWIDLLSFFAKLGVVVPMDIILAVTAQPFIGPQKLAYLLPLLLRSRPYLSSFELDLLFAQIELRPFEERFLLSKAIAPWTLTLSQ